MVPKNSLDTNLLQNIFICVRQNKDIFCWNCGPCWFIKCKSAAPFLRININMIYYEVKKLVSVRNCIFFTTLLPIIQSRRQTVQSDVWLTYESFFWTGSFWWTSWISSPNLTKSSKTVCKLIKTRFRMPDCQLRQNIGVCDPMTLVFELQFLQQSFRWRNSLTRAKDRWTK